MLHSSSAPNVLAVRFSSIGDVLLTTPLIRAIRARYPAGRITILTKAGHGPLLSHNPHVTEVIGFESKASITALAAKLRSNGYSHLLDLHDSLRSRALRALVPGRWTSYPKHRLARTVLIHGKRDWYHDWKPVAERYFSAARELSVTPDGGPPDFFLGSESKQEVEEWLESTQLGQQRPIVAVAPGAAHATKRWPTGHWEMLIRQLRPQGFDVVIVGGSEDQAIAAALTGNTCGVVSAAGRFGLQGTGALLQRSMALISGDTGVMHMATGVGTPVLALFGPTVRQFGFFPYTSAAKVIELDLACRPCSSKGGPRCPLGHHRCLGDISPEMVLGSFREMMS